MNDIKKAIAHKIGSTKEQKARVWANLQQKPKIKWMPYVLTASFVFIVFLFITTLFPTPDTNQVVFQGEPSHDNDNSIVSLEEQNENPSKTLPILSTHIIDMPPISYNENYAVKLIESQEAYAQVTDLYGFKINNIDFSKESIVYTQFVSDGCGLVVSDLQLFKEQLHVLVDLPEKLRNKNEIACTAIAKINSVFLVIPKVDITKAVIIHHSNAFETDFEIMLVREVNSLLDGTSIDKIKFNRTQDGFTVEVNNASSIKKIQKIISYAQQVLGIANVARPEWTTTLYGPNDDLNMLFITFAEDLSSASIIDRADTHTLYTLDETLAPRLFELLQRE